MPDDEPRQQVPGCGLAVFGLLLLGMFVLSVGAILVSTASILSAGKQLTPQKLAYGGVVDAGILAPMRAAGLIGPDEVPDAYHAENGRGTEACAISTGRVLRLGSSGNQQMPLASITGVEQVDDTVVIHGDTTIVCHFGADEGGDRFARMLDNRDVR